MTIPDRLAANVGWLFTELPWRDRFVAARDAGFSQVEFAWPDDPVETADAVRAAGIGVAMLNMPAGDLGAGERGWPNDPTRRRRWSAAFHAALELAGDLEASTVNVLAGNIVHGVSVAEQVACLEENLRSMLPTATAYGVTIVTELLNRQENPDYLLVTLDDAAPLLHRLAPLGWKLQLDTYHLGLTEPDVPAAIGRAGKHIGHLQVADVPGRHEPGTGSLDWSAIRHALETAGYEGAIGLEYRPLAGLGWIPDWAATL